jgi:hypothetical protein
VALHLCGFRGDLLRMQIRFRDFVGEYFDGKCRGCESNLFGDVAG